MGGMRPASAASEAIEAEVSLKVWDVLHGTLRWASEADGPCEAGLIPPMTLLTMSRGHMQSFDLLALKLWICIEYTRKYRQLCGLEKYIVR